MNSSLPQFNLGFFGSRTLWDERVAAIIHDEIRKHNPTALVTTAETGGVCKEARIMARAMGIPLKVHFLNFLKYRNGAFEHRSVAILKDVAHMVVIHDGKSQGTTNELEYAKKLGTPITYHVLEPEEIHDTRPPSKQCELF